MHILRTSRALTLAITLSAGASVATFLEADDHHTRREASYARIHQAASGAELLLDASDALTSAARAYAATRDVAHRRRFEEALAGGARDRGLELLRALRLDDEESQLVQRAAGSADERVRLERRIFAAGEAGDFATALALAYGPELRRLEDGVAGPLIELQAKVAASQRAEVEALTEREAATTRAALGAMLLNILLVLGTVLVFFERSVIRSVVSMTHQASRLVAGDVGVRFGHQSDRSELGDLARALEAYRRVSEAHEQERWVRAATAELTALLQEHQDPQVCARAALTSLARHLSFGVGAIYLGDDGLGDDARELVLVAGYGLGASTPATKLREGEGIVGEAALQRELRILDGAPSGALGISTGLATASASVVVTVPITSDERVLGVVVLGAFRAPTAREHALLAELPAVLGPRLATAQRNVRTAQLLDELRSQAKKLGEQAGELQAQKVALEAQQVTLKRTEAWYSAIIESAPDGIVVTDDRGRIVLTNPQLDHIFGYERGALEGQPLEVLIAEEKRDRHRAERDSFAERAGVRMIADASAVLFGRREDGTEIPVAVGLAMLPDLDGRGTCACAAVRDMSEKHERDEQIRALLRQQEIIFDNAPIGILYAFDGCVVRANSRFAELVGRPGESLVGEHTARFFGGDEQRRAFLDAVAHELETKPSARLEWELFRADGTPLWASCTMSRVLDEAGRTTTLADDRGRDRSAPPRRRDAERARPRRGGGPREGELPREHEPRDPDADERRARVDAARAEDGARPAAAGVSRPNPTGEPAPLEPDRRHPGFLEDRGREAHPRAHRAHAQPGHRERRDADPGEGRRQGPRARLRRRPRHPRSARRRSAEAVAGADQLWQQRREVHREG
ncbi:PAS domain S-box protein [Myxococcota bacterium]|nr:PAS domain S-box protein [Myxococcota bacterium]